MASTGHESKHGRSSHCSHLLESISYSTSTSLSGLFSFLEVVFFELSVSGILIYSFTGLVVVKVLL